MQPATEESPSNNSDPADEFSPSEPDASAADDSSERRNFLVLVIFQVVMRTGWIFKTESVIMPAVLDSIGGAGWLRGCLPMINRFGQSIPPLMMARRVKVAPRKKWGMVASASTMALSFLALAATWMMTNEPKPGWMAAVFLFFYAIFFVGTGLNQISFGTVQGKLIQVTHRGRLLQMASVFGGVFAIGAALTLLPMWIKPDSAQFGLIFGFAGICFLGSAMSAVLLREKPDNYKQESSSVWDPFRQTLRTLRDDANFRWLVMGATLFGSSMILFPHYQALGREKLGLTMDNLIWYVVIQNLGTALFSLPMGWLADRYGNRLVLRLAFLVICFAPVSALLMVYFSGVGKQGFYLIFVLVGLTPMTIRALSNYTLEICEPEDHPRYLSTLGLCVAAPVYLSPLVGRLVDVFDFAPIFLTVSGTRFPGVVVDASAGRTAASRGG